MAWIPHTPIAHSSFDGIETSRRTNKRPVSQLQAAIELLVMFCMAWSPSPTHQPHDDEVHHPGTTPRSNSYHPSYGTCVVGRSTYLTWGAGWRPRPLRPCGTQLCPVARAVAAIFWFEIALCPLKISPYDTDMTCCAKNHPSLGVLLVCIAPLSPSFQRC